MHPIFGLIVVWALLAPQAAGALGSQWRCSPQAQQDCRAGEGCGAAAPWLGEMALYGALEGYQISYCTAGGEAVCFQGVFEQDREGWPDWGLLGEATVEPLPLKRSYDGKHGFFGSFDVNERSLVVTTLSIHGQTTVWFDCRIEG